MRIALTGVLLATAALAPAARADFAIVGSPPPEPPSTRPAQPTTAPPGPQRFKTAEGFGKRIPLAFAVRQIVPKTVKVTYGSGANPASLVDWTGGHPWNRVLAAAIEPLGLRLVITSMAVEIRK